MGELICCCIIASENCHTKCGKWNGKFPDKVYNVPWKSPKMRISIGTITVLPGPQPIIEEE